MTANELAESVLTKYDSLYSLTAPGFDDVRLSIILTYAQFRYVNSILFRETNLKQQSFDETEIRKQGLAALIKDGDEAVDPPSISSSQVGTQFNGTFWELPDDFWIAILEQGLVNIPDCRDKTLQTYTRIPIEATNHNKINRMPYTYNSPYCEGGYEGLILRLTHSPINNKKIHELITDGTFNITKYYLRYLKIPRNIVVDFTDPNNQVNPELSEGTHESISDLAVKIMKGIVDGNNSIENLNMDFIQ